MPKESLGKRVSEKIADLLIGPLTEGKIIDIHRDDFSPEYFHLLVQTKTGEQKEFIQPERSLSFVSGEGLQIVELFDTIQLGSSYSVRVHGKGFIPGLTTKMEEDPFKLRQKTS